MNGRRFTFWRPTVFGPRRRHLPLTRCPPELPPKYAWQALGVHVQERLSRLLCQSARASIAITSTCLNQNTIRKLRSHNVWIAWITTRRQHRHRALSPDRDRGAFVHLCAR
jgi:hypothetical protein